MQYGMFLGGVFVVAIVTGSWWLAFVSSVAVLVTRRSYPILFGGILLDVLFAPHTVGFVFPFFTITLLCTTVLVEFVRERLFLGR